MKYLFLAFVTSFIAFNVVQGLSDICKLSSQTLVKGCDTDNPACCEKQSPCRAIYRLEAIWATQVEISTNPFLYTCPKQCQRHFKKCSSKCRCISYTTETRGGRACKCRRGVRAFKVFQDCRNACKKARIVCRRGCFAGLTNQKCVLGAKTEVKWEGAYEGKCMRVCKPDVPGIKEVCPIVSTVP